MLEQLQEFTVLYYFVLGQREEFNTFFLFPKWLLLFMPPLSQVLICICAKERKKIIAALFFKRKNKIDKGF